MPNLPGEADQTPPAIPNMDTNPPSTANPTPQTENINPPSLQQTPESPPQPDIQKSPETKLVGPEDATKQGDIYRQSFDKRVQSSNSKLSILEHITVE